VNLKYEQEDTMKKLLSVSLILLALGSMAFAEDAKVMPMMVGRVYFAPTFAFAVGGYDEDGSYESLGSGKGSLKALNLGFALEYGVIDWITAALQWAPGWTVWSDVDRKVPRSVNLATQSTVDSDSSVNGNGPADIFLGAKIQIIGEKAPVKSTMFRFAVGPGIKIPLPATDMDEQFKNAGKGDDVTASNGDYHVFGTGVRVYFDYIINEHFFINLYNETLFYPVKGDLRNSGYGEYALIALGAQAISSAMAPALAAMGNPDIEPAVEVNYGYDLTFEAEGVYTTPLAQGITLSAGLPVNYKFTPGNKYSFDWDITGTVLDENIKNAYAGLPAALQLKDQDPTHLLTVKPNVSVFITKTPMPLEFKLTYTAPVWGKNIPMAKHSVGLQARLYFALPGRPQ
jgi:hypothetical protein